MRKTADIFISCSKNKAPDKSALIKNRSVLKRARERVDYLFIIVCFRYVFKLDHSFFAPVLFVMNNINFSSPTLNIITVAVHAKSSGVSRYIFEL